VTARTSQNDIERFESLYGANANVRRRAVNSSSDVSDIVSEVFTTAWRRINDVPPFPQDRLWLFGVAHKCLLGHPRAGHIDSGSSRTWGPNPIELNF
jgi:DNA-directed RNA polymerase specialized sigma24 family protein